MKSITPNPHRLAQNPLEKAFLDAWGRANVYGHMLEYLLSDDPDQHRAAVSEQDELVAATIIQWLGSPVGQAFLEGVLEQPIRENMPKHLQFNPDA